MPDWTTIDTVLLDMDGTLLDLRYDNCLWNDLLPDRWAAVRGIDPQEARRRLLEQMRAIRSTIEFYSVDYWSTFTGLDLRALHEEPAALLGWRPGASAFLDRLGERGLRRVLVTNAHRTSLEVKDAHTGIAARLDAVVSSHDYGAPKEDAGFWRRLGQCEPFDPRRTLLIDDNAEVLAAAARHGIAHLLTVEQPDSGRNRREQLAWPAFNDFAEIMPP
jgi:putative hydrolase of the HAD superfamily